MFFAVLIASLALAIGVVIYDLVVRELALSQISIQSQYAAFAADTGADCALYWDAKYRIVYGGPKPFFPAPWITGWAAPSGADFTCNQQNVATQLAIATNIIQTANDATSTFSVSMDPAASTDAPCATVSVHKYYDTLGGVNIRRTAISADGYNTCNTLAPNRLQRSLFVIY
ncbi:MAG: hypothetical protein QG621_521 [Patescibacteria group bacterium]|jgi:hypothetical protein|nr:hypothetical protein [Patescibacteria group bacterium]